MRKLMAPLALGIGATAAAFAAAAAENPFLSAYTRTTSIAVYGDAPYGTGPTDTSEFLATPAFIESINTDRDVSLVLHVGDIHSGKQYCTLAYDQSIYDLWTAFGRPLVYTPGDNEWTDCHKPKEGGHQVDADGNPIDYADGNPAANLELIRSIFFSDPGLTLGRPMPVISQRYFFDRSHWSDSNYVENVMFVKSNVLFVALNIPGGSNNDTDIWFGESTMSQAQADEVSERTGADIRWLDTAFRLARLLRVSAVVIQTQADMWDLDGTAPGNGTDPAPHLAAYEDIIGKMAAEAKAFRKPVLLFNGDSHVYRSDNPFVKGAPCVVESGDGTVPCSGGDDAWMQHPGYGVPNFHRVVVHGSTFPLEWLKVTIDPRSHGPATEDSFGPFSWERMTQP
jgi:hypothetical protein